MIRGAECGYRGYRRYRAATYSIGQQASATKIFYLAFVQTVKPVCTLRLLLLGLASSPYVTSTVSQFV